MSICVFCVIICEDLAKWKCFKILQKIIYLTEKMTTDIDKLKDDDDSKIEDVNGFKIARIWIVCY